MNSTANRVTKASPLELLIGKEARPFGLIPINEEESKVDVGNARAQAVKNIKNSPDYNKSRFDRNKAKIVKHKIGDYVLLKNEERHQTKLDPKFRGPFVVTEVLEGDRYVLKSLSNKRTYKYAHENLRKMPEGQIPTECEIIDEEGTDGEGVEKNINTSTSVE